MQDAFSAPLGLPVRQELLLKPLAQAGQQHWIAVNFWSGWGETVEDLHKVVPWLKTALLNLSHKFSRFHPCHI
jgi:hypothetical protein